MKIEKTTAFTTKCRLCGVENLFSTEKEVNAYLYDYYKNYHNCDNSGLDFLSEYEKSINTISKEKPTSSP